MKSFFIGSLISLPIIGGIGCTDAMVSHIKSYGKKSVVTCVSGGKVVFTAVSSGKVMEMEGGGWEFRSDDGVYTQTFADCFVQVDENEGIK